MEREREMKTLAESWEEVKELVPYGTTPVQLQAPRLLLIGCGRPYSATCRKKR